MVHELKILTQDLDAILAGHRSFDIRPNVFDFTVGDDIIYYEFFPNDRTKQGRALRVKITYIFNDVYDLVLKPNVIIMSIKKLS